jgi:hypothetical protein
MDRLFEFERDFAASLACIPMSVRLKLDTCGVKISLAQWTRLSEPERARALELPCARPADCASFRAWLVGRIEAHGEAPRSIPVDPVPAWENAAAVPPALNEYLKSRALAPLTPAEWQRLAPLERFALLKLSRPSHDNVNLEPALREFGIPRS